MSQLLEKIKGYIRLNWGALFVLAFIVLLIAAAALLSVGLSNEANNIAVYAFYALVTGIVLQIASYLKYGDGNAKDPKIPSSAPIKWRFGRKTLAIVTIVLVTVAGLGSVAYYRPSSTSRTTFATTTHTIGRLSAGISYIISRAGPNNSTQFVIGVNQTGGLAPFNFTVYWSDGFNQSNNVGVFIRSFLSDQVIPNSAEITVTSSDGQTTTLFVNFGQNQTTSKSSSPEITFLATGLPAGLRWSVTLSNITLSSDSNEIVFNFPLGTYNYTISNAYNQNLSEVYVASPLSGIVTSKGTNLIVDVKYSSMSVRIPTNQILILKSFQSFRLPNSSQEFNIIYFNNFPTQFIANIIVLVKSSNVTSLTIAKSNETLSFEVNSTQSAILVINNIAAGQYSLSIYAESLSGIVISRPANYTLAIS
jgi:hypothetical protein